MSLLNEAINRCGEFTGRIIGFKEVKIGKDPQNQREAIELELNTHQKFLIFNVRALDNLGGYAEGNSVGEILKNVRDKKVEITYEVSDYVNEQGYTYYNLTIVPKGGWKIDKNAGKMDETEVFNPANVDLSEIQ